MDILLVDDEPEICELLQQILEDRGFTVAAVADAKQGLEMIAKEKPPVVLSDITMPGISGLEMLLRLRESGMPSAVAILSAHNETARVVEAMQIGAIDYVFKPFDPSDLSQRAPHWVELGRQLQAIKEGDDSSDSLLSLRLRLIEQFQLKNNSLGKAAHQLD